MAETKTAKPRATKSTAQTSAPTDAFAMQNMEVPEAVREFAEQSIESAKDSYAKIKTAAEEATDIMEDSYETSRQGVLELNMKSLDAAKTTTDAAFAFFKDMLAVKTVAEAIELQSAFAHKQFDAAMSQSKDMQEMFTKITTEAVQPAKAAIEKSFKDLRAA